MSEKRSYRRVFQAFTEKPWAILPAKLAQLAEILVRRADGQRLSDEELAELIAAETYSAKSRSAKKQGGAVAVIPVYGVIIPRADIFSKMSGGTGMDEFTAAITQAANDPNVSSILLDVDSPGGQVDLVPEAAAAIRSARAKKQVTAVANTMAASAAYWLASQASELVVTPSGEVGSVGVFAAHQDISVAEEMMGIKTTLISAGKYKTELSPFAPLTDEARQAVQENVNEYYGMFTRDVASGRRASVSAVRAGFGEGRMVTAQAAVEQGMADRVDTFEATLNRMLGSVTSNTAKALGALSAEEARAAENLPSLSQTVFFPIVGSTASSTSPVSMWTTNFEFIGNSGQTVSESSEEISEEIDSPEVEDVLDGNPQALADLRKTVKETAISEHENYLDLLRRMQK